MEENWEEVHMRALGSVTRDMGIKYYRECGIPGATNLHTMEEESKYQYELTLGIIFILCMQLIINNLL